MTNTTTVHQPGEWPKTVQRALPPMRRHSELDIPTEREREITQWDPSPRVALKSTFSQLFYRGMWLTVQCEFCSTIIIRLNKLWKAKFFILCDVILLVRRQEKLWTWSLLGLEKLRPVYTCDFSCDFDAILHTKPATAYPARVCSRVTLRLSFQSTHCFTKKTFVQGRVRRICTRNRARNRIKNRMCKRAFKGLHMQFLMRFCVQNLPQPTLPGFSSRNATTTYRQVNLS